MTTIINVWFDNPKCKFRELSIINGKLCTDHTKLEQLWILIIFFFFLFHTGMMKIASVLPAWLCLNIGNSRI